MIHKDNININGSISSENVVYGSNLWNKIGENIEGEGIYNDSTYEVLSLSSDGTVVAIGYQSNSDNADYSGSVRVYKWRQYTQTDIDNDTYHYASREQNDTQTKPLIITQPTSTNPIVGTSPIVGNYYWTQLGLDINGESVYHFRGHSVSLSSDGNIVAISSYGSSKNGTNSGRRNSFPV